VAVETVQVLVVDQQTPTPVAIENTLVRIFDVTGATLVTQDYTDANGIADFTLDGSDPPIEYQIRLSKVGVAFDGNLGDDSKSPQLISIYSPPTAAPNGTNNFRVKGQTFSRPVATDPRLCRASGFFRRADGEPYPNLDLIFTPRFKPAIVDGDSVMWGDINIRTDDSGYAEIDLYRGGEYTVEVETLEDDLRSIIVPDSSSENLVELLFTVVDQVIFDPTSLIMAVGDEEEVVTTVVGSDQRVLEGSACGDVVYEVEDTEVASVSVLNDKIVVIALKTGSTQLTVSRRDESVVVIPDTGIVHTPLSITVS
jgi:hypothetical protein